MKTVICFVVAMSAMLPAPRAGSAGGASSVVDSRTPLDDHGAWLGDEWRPVRLNECPPELRANLTINYNSGTGHVWRRFCYRGEQRFSRHLKRKKIPSLGAK